MSISRDTIELVRSRARIEDIIARYVPSLKKRGSNFVGLCPFHKEKTPSFTVSAEKQIFHCFGCHEGGNVFSFIAKLENIEFPKAVRFVGRLVGIDVRDDERPVDTVVGELLRINEYAVKLYEAYLASSDGIQGLEYLQARGVNEDAIKDFRLGYAPDGWDFITSRLKNTGAKMDLAALTGLVGSKESAGELRYYDRFRKRVIFPIIDSNGSAVGFGGRIIGEGEPKYLNSSESPVFKKRSLLYGYYHGKSEISSLKRAIIVEGYLDVIGCHQVGIKNVVAPLGTALTEDHVRFLSRVCSEIVLLFDADSAGIKASIRSLEVMKDINVTVKVASLSEDDPFDYIQKHGIRPFMSVVDSALPPADYKIKRVLALKKQDPMLTMLSLFDVVKEIEFDTERSLYLKKIADLTGNDVKAVTTDFQRYIRGSEKPNFSIKKEKSEEKRPKSIEDKGFVELIVLLIHYPMLITKAVLDFSEEDFKDLLLKSIFSRLVVLYNEEETLSTEKLFDIFIDGEEKRFLEGHVTTNYRVDAPDDAYTEIYLTIRQHGFDKKIAYYADLIKKEADSGRVKEYLVEIDALRRKKEELSHYIYHMKGRKRE